MCFVMLSVLTMQGVNSRNADIAKLRVLQLDSTSYKLVKLDLPLVLGSTRSSPARRVSEWQCAALSGKSKNMQDIEKAL